MRLKRILPKEKRRKNSSGSRSLLMLFLLLPMILTGCSRWTDKAEQNLSHTTDEEITTDNETAKEENTETTTDITDRKAPAAYTGETITLAIEGSDGRSITIAAQVHADGIGEVSCYQYIPIPLTEEHQADLFQEMHPAENWNVLEAAAYNLETDAWEFVTPLGESWIYQITYSEIPGEEVLNHENTTANIFSNTRQVVPILVQKDTMDVENVLLGEVVSPHEIEQLGLYDISSIDKDGSYACSFIHICESEEGQTYAKAVFKKILDGIPVTAWHDFSTATGNNSPFPVKVWGSLFSEKEIGLDNPILSASEAAAAMQEQIDSIPIQKEPLSITEIRLEYLSVISPEGELLIVPVWRFYAGKDAAERSLRSEEVIAVNAISGGLIWENRAAFVE